MERLQPVPTAEEFLFNNIGNLGNESGNLIRKPIRNTSFYHQEEVEGKRLSSIMIILWNFPYLESE